jgi:putative tricarboxylic transport membrane protein
VIGYLMIRYQYPRITITIALVLADITERSFFQAMGISDNSWAIFYTRDVSLILIGLIIFSLMIPSIRMWLRKRSASKTKEDAS